MPPPYPQSPDPYGYDRYRYTYSHGFSPTPHPGYHLGGQWNFPNPHQQYRVNSRPPLEHRDPPRRINFPNPNPQTQLPPWMPPNTPPRYFLGPSRTAALSHPRAPRRRRLRNPPSPVPLTSLGSDQLECHICLEEFGTANPDKGESEGPVRLPCGHIFGASCFDAWLQVGLDDVRLMRYDIEAQPWRRCPVCQGELDVVEG